MAYPTLKEAIVIARDALDTLPELQRVIFGPAPRPPIPPDLEEDATTLFVGCIDLKFGDWYLMSRPNQDLCETTLMDAFIMLTDKRMKRIE